MKNPTTEEKITILGQYVTSLHVLIKEQNMGNHRNLNSLAIRQNLNHPAQFTQASGAAIPSRPQVLEIVIRTLRDAEIMNNAEEFTPLTDRFVQINTEDAHMGHSGFRIGRFLDILHMRLPWHWGIGPNELLDGTLPDAAAITDRCLASA